MDAEEEGVQERDWGWVFHALTKGPAAQRCKIPLPDTILFKDSEPCRWVFTAKSGHVMSRSGNKLKLAKIKRRFMDRHHVEGDDTDDRRVCVSRKAGGDGMIVKVLTAAELTELCSSSGSRGGFVALQDFIEASRLTTFKCKYTRTDDYGGQTKGFKFETHKVNEVSAETLKVLNQGGQGDMRLIKSQMSEVNQLVEGLTWRIVRCVESRLPMMVQKMVAEFVVDDNNQAWFTHTSELTTGPKPEKWHAPSGHSTKIEPDRHRRPQLIRRKPLPDGTPVCCGDFCNSNIAEIMGHGDDSNPGSDLSLFGADSKIAKIALVDNGSEKQEKSQSPPIAEKTILYKSIFLQRMEASGSNMGVEDALLRKQLERRVLPQMKPSIQSRHSLHDYYEMIPVCDNCYKAYCHHDRERARNPELDSPLQAQDQKNASLASGGAAVKGMYEEEVYDMSAKGIRQRLTDLYTMQGKPLSNNFTQQLDSPTRGDDNYTGLIHAASFVSREGNRQYTRAPGKNMPKRSVSVTDEDRRLPNLVAQQGKAFPRSKTSMFGGNKINQQKRGVSNTLPSLA